MGAVGAVRLELRLSSQSEWIKIFDPRDWTVFVPTRRRRVENGATLRIDLDVGGWRVTLRGTVVGTREEPTGVVVALGGTEREKINYLNGFVRGGLLNLREKRRLPIRLPGHVRRGRGPGEHVHARTSTKRACSCSPTSRCPRPRRSTCSSRCPGKPQPLSLVGKVSHTILAADEEPPGMGIVFDLDDAQRERCATVIEELEAGARRRASCRRRRVE